MSQLYFTELGAVGESAMATRGVPLILSAAAIAAAERAGLSEGMPFILDGDGRYDVDLNRFFRGCPTVGVRSQNSLRAYGRDLAVWMRFLREQRDGKSVWHADRDDLAAYHVARRRSAPNRVNELEAEIAALRGRESDELRDLRGANRNMAQHIQALSLLAREQEQQITRLQA